MLFDTSDAFCQALTAGRRLLGLDVGETTIGLALSDTSRTIATPHLTIERAKFSKDVLTLEAIITKQSVGGLVVGYPINMDGSHGPRTQSTRTFVSNLGKHIRLPMLLWDERMSTLAVERMMVEADMSRSRRAVLVDKLAASYMLQGFLDSIKA
jgi:putative Holliday junction resolvase